MKKVIVSVVVFSAILLAGCSGDDVATSSAQQQAQPAAVVAPKVSQSETMEQIWASDLDAAEKARRVRELMQASR